jgi:hypothetical protein
LAVLGLVARVLDVHDEDAAGQAPLYGLPFSFIQALDTLQWNGERHLGIHFVDILPAWSARARECDVRIVCDRFYDSVPVHRYRSLLPFHVGMRACPLATSGYWAALGFGNLSLFFVHELEFVQSLRAAYAPQDARL